MRRNIKKGLSVILVIAMCFAIYPSVATAQTYSGSCGENAVWEFDDVTGTLTISGTGEMENYTDVTAIPWNDYKSQITSLQIQDGITALGDYFMYGCDQLASVTLPSGITSLGIGSFGGCSSLSSFDFGQNEITSIPEMCFAGCGFIEFNIPDTVTSIDRQAFCGCSNLESIYIPNTIYTLPEQFLTGCTNLKRITIPESVGYLTASCFSGCKSLTSVIIPKNVGFIDYGCFQNCTSLTSIYIMNKSCQILNYMETTPAFDTTATIYGLYGSTAEEYCTNFGNPFSIICTDASENHTFETTTTATCTTDGTVTYTCTLCGYTYDEVQSATGHSFDADNEYCLNNCGTINPDYQQYIGGTCGDNAFWEFDKVTGALRIYGTGAITTYDVYTEI
ncbi:MAG: leucine-rich repeat domain-containing protein, partial [Eubacterium sp.]